MVVKCLLDNNGNSYTEVGHARLTYVQDLGWHRGPGIRIQAYKNGGIPLHPGAEVCLNEIGESHDVIQALITLVAEAKTKPRRTNAVAEARLRLASVPLSRRFTEL
jgi:hypothetical protein